MKQILAFFLGCVLTLLAVTLFGSLTYVGIAALYAFILYRLFFADDFRLAEILLISSAITLELLGTARFGMASLLALIIWLLHYIFAQRLRFTSLYARYIVALLLLFFIDALLIAPASLGHRLLAFALLSLPVMAITLYASTAKATPHYELL